jgi:hypothetical protein
VAGHCPSGGDFEGGLLKTRRKKSGAWRYIDADRQGAIPKAYFSRLRTVRWQAILKKLGITAAPNAGGNVLVSCVFHRENTPSLQLRPNGYFFCFGCSESGDVFSFIRQLKRGTIASTIRFFSRHFGIPSPYAHPKLYIGRRV